jgi:hypothetical protein
LLADLDRIRSLPQASLEQTTEFLNVDLELAGPVDLSKLIDGLGSVFVLHQWPEPPASPDKVNLELGGEEVGVDLEATMSLLLDRIEDLDADARSVWRSCTKRVFNVGVQGGLQPRSIELGLSAGTIQRLAACDGELCVTVYGASIDVLSSGT